MEHLEALGKVAGVGGIALGVLLLVFRDAVAPHIPYLTKKQAYSLLRSIVVLSFLAAVAGVGAWTWIATHPNADVAAKNRDECLKAAAAARTEGGGSPAAGVISAGGNVEAGRNIGVEGAGALDRPAITTECGDVTAGEDIEVTAGDGEQGAEPAQ